MKLKQIFLLNFNWIFWIIILGGGIVFAIRKTKINKEISTIVIPISAVCVMIIMFGCLYITWTHVRYILPLIPMLYLIATFIIAEFGQRVYFSLNILVSILLLIQNFYVIDPIMINAFDSISVGNGKVFDMKVSGSKRVASDKVFNDCIVYNRQYIYWGETLMNTLNKVGYDGNMLIVLPENVNCEEWLLVGTRNGNVLWNKQERKFEYYNELKEVPEQCVWLNTCHVSGMEQAYNGNDILYIIPRWADIDMEFVSDKNVISQGEIDNKGYNIQYMIMRVKNNLPLVNGSYKVAPKQDNGLNLHTNGGNGGQVFLQKNVAHISLEAIDSIVYHLNFGEYQVALDVPKGLIDGNGTVQVWSENGTSGQRWVVEEVGDYYMICFKGYALTYDLNDNSVKLCPKTGEDNQLWSFDS